MQNQNSDKLSEISIREDLDDLSDNEISFPEYQIFAKHVSDHNPNSNPFFIIQRNQRIQKQNRLLRGQLLNYNRKQKSLEQLSKKFLELFLPFDSINLQLDKITSQLGVQRRRIYDIINILQSLKVVFRNGKNNYRWNGLKSVVKTIQEYEACHYESKTQISKMKKEKSLQILSVGFLKLFIHWKKAMSLQQAAKKLVGEIQPQKLKTKIRRLYDIANVYKSLGLLKKTYLSNRKPGFQWVGQSGLCAFLLNYNNPEFIQLQTQKSIKLSIQEKIEEKPMSFFQQYIMKEFIQKKESQTLQNFIDNWNSCMWSIQKGIKRTKSMYETNTKYQQKIVILKDTTNQKSTESTKKGFGSFKKIQIQPKILFSN